MAKGLAQDHGRAGKCPVHVTVGIGSAKEHVAGDAVVEERSAGGKRRVGIGDSRQRLAVHLDEIAGVGGLGRAVGAEPNHRLADEADALGSEGRPLGGPEPRTFQSRRERLHPLRQILPGERRGDSRRPPRSLDVDAPHPRVRMDAPHEGRVEQLGQPEIVEVGAASCEQARVLDALDAPARQARGDAQMRTPRGLRPWRREAARRRPGARAAPRPN